MGTVPDILTIAESGKAEELWQELRDKADRSLYYFVKVVCNYRDLTEDFHLPFCLKIEADEAVQRAGYLLPRAHFKSTILTKMGSLWFYLRDPEERILIIGESDTVAKKNLIDIKWHCLNNQLLRWLYPQLQQIDPQNSKWTDSEILLPRQGTYDEPTITCDGIGARRTGFHYTRIIYDDPIGDKAAASEAVMDSAWDWIEYAPGLLHDPAKSRERFVGTRWKHGTADVYGRAMVAMPNIRWYVRSAIEGGSPIFPQRFSLATLAEIREREKDYKFNCQYMNNPTAPGGADFDPKWVKEYDVIDVTNDSATLVPRDGTPPISTHRLLRMGFLDPAHGGMTEGCEHGLLAAGMSSDRRRFVLGDASMRGTIGQAVERAHVLNDQWKFYKFWYERFGAQTAVEDMCRERKNGGACPYCKAGHLHEDGKLYVRNPHRTLRLEGFRPEGGDSQISKEERIRLYAQKAFEDGTVYIYSGMTTLRQQIVEFPHGALVDRFDALAYLLKLLRPPMSEDDLESEQAAQMQRRVAGKSFVATEHDYGGYGA